MIIEDLPSQIQSQKELDENKDNILLRAPLSYLPNPQHSNILLVAASRLLIWMIYIKNLSSPPPVSSLWNTLHAEIRKFEQYAQSGGYDTITILALRYCLCTTLDEAILSTKWGINSEWADQTLLNFFHKETCGGEKFYHILDALTEESNKNIPILEPIFILLALGFKGKFYDKGEVTHQAILFQLFQKIQPFLSLPHSLLLKTDQLHKKKKPLPLWSLFVLLLASLLISEALYEHYAYKMEFYTLKIMKNIKKQEIDKKSIHEM